MPAGAGPAAHPSIPGDSTALHTDHYELTMLASALQDGTAQRDCVFEVFCRSLLGGRRYGVVAGTERVVDAVTRFRFDDAEMEFLERTGVVDARTLAFLTEYRFRGDVAGYREGELFFPYSPILTVRGSFAEAVVLETVVLSILNHDSAVATAASRMVNAAQGRPIIEMGSRRTHEAAAVDAARAAYLAGFASTSNLEAGRSYGVPTRGTVAHAFIMLHDREQDAFRAQVTVLGEGSTLLVDTYDTLEGIRRAVDVAGPGLGAVRLDSGDLHQLAVEGRALLDSLGATGTRIVATGDLDEYKLAALADAPVDAYGVGTSVVTGSGVPAPGFVYKVSQVDGHPVAKRSPGKVSVGGHKHPVRRHDAGGRARLEIAVPESEYASEVGDRPLAVPLVEAGARVGPAPSLAEVRDFHARVRAALPAEALDLQPGEPAIATIRHSEQPE